MITVWIGVILRKNLLFLNEISPEPSILTLLQLEHFLENAGHFDFLISAEDL